MKAENNNHVLGTQRKDPEKKVKNGNRAEQSSEVRGRMMDGGEGKGN